MIQTLVEAAGEGREAEVDWGGWPSPLHVRHRFEGAPHSCLSVPLHVGFSQLRSRATLDAGSFLLPPDDCHSNQLVQSRDSNHVLVYFLFNDYGKCN